MTLLKSWVASANSADTPFPLNNLPYGVFSVRDDDPRCGVAIGDMILDLAAAEGAGLLDLSEDMLFDVPFWNDVMEQGPDLWAALRARLTDLLAVGAAEEPLLTPHLVAQSDAVLLPNIPTFMRASITQSMLAPCSVGLKTHCHPTGCTFRLDTTGGRLRLWCLVQMLCARTGKPKHPMLKCRPLARVNGWISSLRWAQSSARLPHWAHRSRWRRQML